VNPFLITLISATIIVPAIIAGIVSQYQRETTSIEDKYTRRSSAEIDETYHQSYLTNLISDDATYSDEVVTAGEVTGPTIKLSVGNDRDGDGIPDSEELTTQPDNPDSDGDGTIDSQDPAPNDPTIGKTAPPPPLPPAGPTVEAGELKINELYKNVRNLSRGATQWVNHTTARPGETLAFLIYLVLENTGNTGEYEATISDFIDDNLRHISSGTISINNQTPDSLAGSSWMNGYVVKVPAGQTKIIEIRFSAIAELHRSETIILSNNIVKVVTPQNTATDNAFVSININSGSTTPPTL
jgi:uncharacterized repeat protein (TIGR01451 family)